VRVVDTPNSNGAAGVAAVFAVAVFAVAVFAVAFFAVAFFAVAFFAVAFFAVAFFAVAFFAVAFFAVVFVAFFAAVLVVVFAVLFAAFLAAWAGDAIGATDRVRASVAAMAPRNSFLTYGPPSGCVASLVGRRRPHLRPCDGVHRPSGITLRSRASVLTYPAVHNA
jgi:hypothetical protein